MAGVLIYQFYHPNPALRPLPELALSYLVPVAAISGVGGLFGFVNAADRRSQFLPLVALKHGLIYAGLALWAACMLGISLSDKAKVGEPFPLSSFQIIAFTLAGAIFGMVKRLWPHRGRIVWAVDDLARMTVNFSIRSQRALHGAGKALLGVALIGLALAAVLYAFGVLPAVSARTAPIGYAGAGVIVVFAMVFTGAGIHQLSHGLLTVTEAFKADPRDLEQGRPITDVGGATLREILEGTRPPRR